MANTVTATQAANLIQLLRNIVGNCIGTGAAFNASGSPESQQVSLQLLCSTILGKAFSLPNISQATQMIGYLKKWAYGSIANTIEVQYTDVGNFGAFLNGHAYREPSVLTAQSVILSVYQATKAASTLPEVQQNLVSKLISVLTTI